MGSYHVCLIDQCQGDAGKFKPIDGEKVVIEGFEELDLFIHQPPEGAISDLYVISEGKTGLALTGWRLSPEEARREAKDKLEAKGLSETKAMIDKRLEISQSPRYMYSGENQVDREV